MMFAFAIGASGLIAIVRTEGGAMPAATPSNPIPTRRQWVEPTLTRHDSLTALTQQDYGQYPPGYDAQAYQMGVYADSVPGSVTVFPV